MFNKFHTPTVRRGNAPAVFVDGDDERKVDFHEFHAISRLAISLARRCQTKFYLAHLLPLDSLLWIGFLAACCSLDFRRYRLLRAAERDDLEILSFASANDELYELNSRFPFPAKSRSPVKPFQIVLIIYRSLRDF